MVVIEIDQQKVIDQAEKPKEKKGKSRRPEPQAPKWAVDMVNIDGSHGVPRQDLHHVRNTF